VTDRIPITVEVMTRNGVTALSAKVTYGIKWTLEDTELADWPTVIAQRLLDDLRADLADATPDATVKHLKSIFDDQENP
jgi:hypothetical protein